MLAKPQNFHRNRLAEFLRYAILVAGCAGCAASHSPSAGLLDAGTAGDGRTEDAGPFVLGPFVDVAVAETFTCAVQESGEVVCFGDNTFGQLGDGTTEKRISPARVQGLHDIIQVTVGAGHACALHHTGDVSCWGRQSWHGEGDGSSDGQRVPVRIEGVTGARQLVAGPRSTCAIVEAGRVVCWGRRHLAQRVPSDLSLDAQSVAGIEGVTALSVGDDNTCAVHGGRVSCWERADEGAIPVPGVEGAVDVYVESWNEVLFVPKGSLCVLHESGDVMCGGTDQAELFWFTEISLDRSAWIPDATRILPGPVSNQWRRPSDALAFEPECGLVETNVSCLRQLDPAIAPTLATFLSDVKAIAGSRPHGCAVLAAGDLWCWGDNSQGQLGIGVPSRRDQPVEVLGLTDAKFLAAGQNHTCAVRHTGEAMCWGSNTDGQTGTVPSTAASGAEQYDPRPFIGLDDAEQVFAAESGTCFVRTSGELLCAGSAPDPAELSLGGERITGGALSSTQLCVTLEGGRVQCVLDARLMLWDESLAERGDWLNNLRDVEEVAAAGFSTCVRLRTGEVRCRGSRDELAGLDDAVDLAASSLDFCAARSSGAVICYGTPREPLRELEGITDAVQVEHDRAAGGGPLNHVVLRADGTVVNWNRRDGAVAAPGLNGIVQVATGVDHSCALRNDGQVFCWGSAFAGGLGDGTWTHFAEPVRVGRLPARGDG